MQAELYGVAMLSLFFSLSRFGVRSETPFATNDSDTPTQILARIGEGKVSLASGNWDAISEMAKVLYFSPVSLFCWCLVVCSAVCVLGLYG